MKLSDILTEFSAVPVTGGSAGRQTPTSALAKWGKVNAPLPHQFAKDRVWAEEKEKKKKKRRKLRDLEQGLDNATPRPY